MSDKIHPVILCGGSGTRLWPLSRALYPKQLLPLASNLSLLQETALRVGGDPFAEPVFICNEEHRFVVAEQARMAGLKSPGVVLEPVGRNTAPAAAASALILAETDPDAVLLLMPSDHVIEDKESFHAAVAVAAGAAKKGALVTFGIRPTKPLTGYGYIQGGESYGGMEGCFGVRRFVEKPDLETAKNYVDSGDYYWNSGLFVFTAKTYLAELERLAPEILAACRKAVAEGREEPDFHRLSKEAFSASPSQSIDYAVMEHTEAAAVVPVAMGWSDVGSWAALWDVRDKDRGGNVIEGDVIAHDSVDCYISSNGPLVATVGLKDTVVVATDDAVLVLPKDRSEEVKGLTEALKKAERPEYASHLTVYRPWGSYRTLKVGDRFLIKHIVLTPGARISLQRHRHRAEHWVVVGGTARVTCGEETFDLGEDQSTYIPIGSMHRLENPFDDDLHIIEVQSGTTLSEDDIERFDDIYGRV